MSVPASYFNNAGRLASGLGSTFGNSYLGNTGSALGVLSGLQQGGVGGYGRAAAGAGNLYGALTGNSALTRGAGALGSALGIYGGLRQGGWQGDTQAALSAGRLAANAGWLPPGVGQALGYAAIPLQLYNFAVNDTASGRTGSDALGGAETGAEIGSMFGPIGMGAGALIGGAAGALASAFGPGAKDPETATVQNLINYTSGHGNTPSAAQNVQNPYLELAGLMDERSSTLPEYQKYGRMGEQQFTKDLASHINQAFSPSGNLSFGPNGELIQKNPGGGTTTYTNPQDVAGEVYQNAVEPWVNNMGSGYKDVGSTYGAVNQGLLQDMTGQYISGQAANDWRARSGDQPFANIYQGSPFQAAPVTHAQSGGHMKKRQSALDDLYRGSFADRERHYDSGGYVNYFTPSYTNMTQETPSLNWDPSLQTPDTSQFASDPSNIYAAPGNLANPSNDPYGYGITPSGGGGGGLSALQSLAQQHPSLQYAALLPLLAGALGIGQSKPASAPFLPPGFASGVAGGAMPTVNPASMRTQAQVNPNTDWYTYGQHPETQFYNNNALPQTSGYSPFSAAPQMPTMQPNFNGGVLNRPVMAKGGALGQGFDSEAGDDYVQDPGHGDGTSDDIPAKLSGGEYVMDAGTVSMLGNGSNDAGARALDQLRQRVRKHAGKKLVKGKQFMKAKAPEQYLKTGTED